jgi:hypothetical protein
MSMHVVQAIAGPLFSYSVEHQNERDIKAFLAYKIKGDSHNMKTTTFDGD